MVGRKDKYNYLGGQIKRGVRESHSNKANLQKRGKRVELQRDRIKRLDDDNEGNE